MLRLNVIYKPEVQVNRLASSNDLHRMEVIWYEQKMYFRRFSHFSKCKELSMKFITCCTVALQIMLESLITWNDDTGSHGIIISLAIMKNRTFSAHLQGIYEWDVHLLMILSLLQKKQLISASECKHCSNWTGSWKSLLHHFFWMVSTWDGCYGSSYSASCDGCCGSSCSAKVDTLAATAASRILFVGSVQPVSGAVAFWVSFKFVFVFTGQCVCHQSASSVCVSVSHLLVKTEQCQSGRCKLSQLNKANGYEFLYWIATKILHWDKSDILT